MKTKELEDLKQEFSRIKNMGYVKSTREGVTGVGKTFEDLIGKAEDTKGIPDYHGIEIKTRLGYSKSYTTLFNSTPEGKLETQRLCKEYGYPDKILKDKKILNISITKTPTIVANKYHFNLKIDYEKQRLILIIKDRYGHLLEDRVYWNFKTLKEKLNTKLQYVALINAWPTTRNNIKYYKYYKINFYKLKSFEKFIELIDKDIIRISLKIGVYREGLKKGLPHDRGTSFELKALDFCELFEHVYI